MYHHVDYCRIKTFLKACLIFSSLFFTSKIFAGAAERQESIYDAAMKSRNGIGVSNVRAANDMINADITQRVTVDGSNATINTKVSIPANDDSFKRNTAKHAKNLLKGGAYGAGAAAAMGVILDGVGWVIDEGGKVTKKPNEDDVTPSHEYYYSIMNSDGKLFQASTADALCRQYITDSGMVYDGLLLSAKGEPMSCNGHRLPSTEVYPFGLIQKPTNPSYDPSAPQPGNVPVPDGEMEDAFYNWFKNNTHSITDPVTTYIYSPKDSQGNALPKSPTGSDPSFGPNEITDEMMDNYMEHRDANLQNPYTTSIQDSTQTDTTQNPDGSKTTTTTNPDGSKTTTRTDTKTDPDTGEVTTTVTETTTMPDGSTSTKTETSTQTKPKPETTELPAFCEYAATLCTWINRDTEHKADEKSLWEKITDWFDWTKENEELPDDNETPEIKELEIDDLDTGTFKATAGCPAPMQVPVDFGKGGNVEISYEPLCQFAEKWSFVAPLIGFLSGAMIIVGVGRKGEDGEI
jgi:hypothetical protein